MLILALRTDKTEAELGLFDDQKQCAYITWQAHWQLAETIHTQLRDMLAGYGKTFADIQGIVMYEGPGSFTGLRIGLSVGNALASSYGLPVIGTTGEDWVSQGIQKLLDGNGTSAVLPEYGAPVHITQPKK